MKSVAAGDTGCIIGVDLMEGVSTHGLASINRQKSNRDCGLPLLVWVLVWLRKNCRRGLLVWVCRLLDQFETRAGFVFSWEWSRRLIGGFPRPTLAIGSLIARQEVYPEVFGRLCRLYMWWVMGIQWSSTS